MVNFELIVAADPEGLYLSSKVLKQTALYGNNGRNLLFSVLLKRHILRQNSLNATFYAKTA